MAFAELFPIVQFRAVITERVLPGDTCEILNELIGGSNVQDDFCWII